MTLEQLVQSVERQKLEEACHLVFSKMITGESNQGLRNSILRAIDEGYVTRQEIQERLSS